MYSFNDTLMTEYESEVLEPLHIMILPSFWHIAREESYHIPILGN